jgi:hypothetical protein
MLLKEKIQTIIIDDYGNLQKILLLEQIADDYAIEFSNWLFNINKEVLKKQLQEFKKEKGL